MNEPHPIGASPDAPLAWWPALRDLPWDVDLIEWPPDSVIDLPRGQHRHVVRFVDASGRGFSGAVALKELDDELVARELAMLSFLSSHGLPAVRPVGAVVSRGASSDGRPLAPVLITEHLPYAMPLRNLFSGAPVRPDLHERLVDALAVLLVRLHLVGFYWGDCSLSNALFRRDAGDLSACLVDAETAVVHEVLSSGQRSMDLMIACENVGFGLADLAAAGRLRLDDVGAVALVDRLSVRYEQLWGEVTRAERLRSGELWRFHDRVRRLNELGFDVREVEIAGSSAGAAHWRPAVIEAGHHARQLRRMVGIEAEENQARRLLSDLWGYGSGLSSTVGRWLPEAVQAYRWLVERWEPALAAVPLALRGRLSDAELYHQVLDHLWLKSEAAGRDIGIVAAVESFVAEVLVKLPDESAPAAAPAAPASSTAPSVNVH
ncbi:MAG: DUF4032 domain-containing protein [Acidimicrobiia bacterium]